jgi:hypothetical protein
MVFFISLQSESWLDYTAKGYCLQAVNLILESR